MRVVLLTSTRSWRGSGTSYAKLARGLRERGHTAHLVTRARKLTTRLAQEGLEVSEIAGRDAGPAAALALWRLLRRLRAQAILADTPYDVRIAAYATLLHSARIVYRYNLGRAGPGRRRTDRLYLSRVAACVYQSEFIHDDAVARARWMDRIPSYHIPNGYDTGRFAPRAEAGRAFRDRYQILPNARMVLSAAKLTRNKGHEVAIAALNLVRRAGTEVVYVLCGDGTREAELGRLARAYELPTVFTGLLGTEGMIAAYSAADVVVHPSLREIFPNVVGEAMACGRAVIAADAGGTGELLGRDGSTGVLVPPGDPDALADAVRQLLADPARLAAIGASARRRIEEVFPVRRMVDGYATALAEVVGRSR